MHMTKKQRAAVLRLRCIALMAAFSLLFCAVSCQKKQSDDKTAAQNLMKAYMNALCDYDINGMNKSSLARLEGYGDSQEVNAACKALSSRIRWQTEDISINGSAGIAQVTITLPADFEDICTQALSTTMLLLEQDSERLPAETLYDEIKKGAEKAETREILAEIPISKIGNQWFIGKSPTVSGLISDIRTPTAAVYSLIDP